MRKMREIYWENVKKKERKKTELRIKRKTVDIIGERKENFKNEEKKEWE